MSLMYMSVALALPVEIVDACVLLSGNQCEGQVLICGQVHGLSVVQRGVLCRGLGIFVVCVIVCVILCVQEPVGDYLCFRLVKGNP